MSRQPGMSDAACLLLLPRTFCGMTCRVSAAPMASRMKRRLLPLIVSSLLLLLGCRGTDAPTGPTFATTGGCYDIATGRC